MSEPVDAQLADFLLSCAVRRPWAEQDEGPYRRDDQPLRREVFEDREGVPLQLGIRLTMRDGTPGTRAGVEIWHCDALGRYSGFPPPGSSAVVIADRAPRTEYLPDQTFLRGRQETDADGMVEFATIYPGWYPGRTVHIHVMVDRDPAVLISQLYFPDDVNDRVLSQEPYARRPGRDTSNAADGILPIGGEPAVVDLLPLGDGYRAGIGLVLP
jgi:protocatechuate 3,4-dioxygenase beta subunit